MKPNKFTLAFALIFLFSISLISLTSAVAVDANYITLFPGETGRITIEIDNNEDFDIEDVTIELDLSGKVITNEFGVAVGTEILPFTIVGSSERDVDDLDEDDEDRVSFSLRTFTDIKPGDYSIPYILKYTDADSNDDLEKTGSFGIRVSAKTEIDFSIETKGIDTDSAIVGQEGKITLEVINQGLGEIKSVSIQIFPQGYSLLSKDKIFIGTVDADDTDLATFDVIFQSTKPTLTAKVTYKDFDNNEQVQAISIPFKIFSEEEALEMGIIKKSKTGLYISIIIVLIVLWIIYRRMKKKNRSK